MRISLNKQNNNNPLEATLTFFAEIVCRRIFFQKVEGAIGGFGSPCDKSKREDEVREIKWLGSERYLRKHTHIW